MSYTVPPSEPKNVTVSNVGQRSATVSWDPPTNNFHNSLTDVSGYRVSAVQNVFQEGARVATKDKYSQTHEFMDLEEYTLYSFSVAASNAFGYGTASEPQKATTLEAGLLASYIASIGRTFIAKLLIQWSVYW